MTPALKLKQAAEDIKDILKKYDIAGSVVLHTPGIMEHFITLNPTYSIVHQITDEEVRIYSKSEDFKTKDEQRIKNTHSANMMKLLTHGTALNFGLLEPISKAIDEVTGAIHTNG